MTEEYRNTGIAKSPLPEQELKMTGKLNIEGVDERIAIIKDTDHQGREIRAVYKRIGLMYANEDANEENKKPIFSGPMGTYNNLNDPLRSKNLASWKNDRGNGVYLSLKISEKMNGGTVVDGSRKEVDDIPF